MRRTEDTNYNAEIDRLLLKKQLRSLLPEEKIELDTFLEHQPAIRQMDEFYSNTGDLHTTEDLNEKWNNFEKAQHQRKRFLIRRNYLLGAAACFILIITTLLFTEKDLTIHPSQQQPMAAAGKNIQLRLSGGQTLNLNNSTTQQIKAGDAIVTANSKSMQLENSKGADGDYNTLEVPPKMDYKISLADGSTVQLNAVSQLKFPFRFTGATREVWIEGEAYFKIAHQADKPFIVHTKQGDITVLGTEFNVNTYAPGILKTSLVKGAVKLTHDTKTVTLKPGEETIWQQNGYNIHPLDESMTLSWLRGKFYFHNSSLKEIAPMMERWFEVKVVIDDARLANTPFTGSMDKSEPMDAFLESLTGIISMKTHYDSNHTLHLTSL
jgi:ferric-dicitrate binding protein FerR (iron transport regulator)